MNASEPELGQISDERTIPNKAQSQGSKPEPERQSPIKSFDVPSVLSISLKQPTEQPSPHKQAPRSVTHASSSQSTLSEQVLVPLRARRKRGERSKGKPRGSPENSKMRDLESSPASPRNLLAKSQSCCTFSQTQVVHGGETTQLLRNIPPLAETGVLRLDVGQSTRGENLQEKESDLSPVLQFGSEPSLPAPAGQTEAEYATERCLAHTKVLMAGERDGHQRVESLPAPMEEALGTALPLEHRVFSPYSSRQEQLESSHKELTQKLSRLIEEIEQVQKKAGELSETATQRNGMLSQNDYSSYPQIENDLSHATGESADSASVELANR